MRELNSDYSDKGLEECLDSSQIKRRRMLQFTSEGNEVIVVGENSHLILIVATWKESILSL